MAQPRRKTKTPPKTGASQQATNPDYGALIANVHAEALPLKAEVGEIETGEPPEMIDLRESWKQASDAKRTYESAKERAQAAAEKSQEEQQRLKTLQEKLDEERKALQSEKLAQQEMAKQIAEQNEELERRSRELDAQDAELRSREVNAETGFLNQHRAVIAQLETLVREQRDILLSQTQQLVEERTQGYSDLQRELTELRTEEERRWNEIAESEFQLVERIHQTVDQKRGELSQVLADLEAQHYALIEKEIALKAQQGQVDRELRLLESDRQALVEDQKTIEERAANLATARIEKEELQEQRKAFEAEKRAHKEIASDIAAQKEDLEKRVQAMDARDADLRLREANAAAGFITQHQAIIAQIETYVKEQRDYLFSQTQRLVEERSKAYCDLQRELAELRAEEERRLNEIAENELLRLESVRETLDRERAELSQMRADLEARQDELVQKESELNAQQRQVAQERRMLETDLQILNEDQQALDKKVERLAAVRVETLEREVVVISAKLDLAREECTRLQDLLTQREEQDRRFGRATPEEVFEQLRRLLQENQKLKNELALRPSADLASRLHNLETDLESSEADSVTLRMRLKETETQLSRSRIGSLDLETLRDQKKALEINNDLLKQTLEDLRSDVERRLEKSTHVVFPSCCQMDQDEDLQITRPTVGIPALDIFARDLQQRIGYDPKIEGKLYYELSDIRSFLGGLAMSYLTILQGISGTGKTSLPIAFARAVGGGCECIEVQAGWRDRADLIGHYNTFEGQFDEKPFLRALYKAQCSAYKDRLFFIVLDEMNLSFAEQYFADLISEMEKPQTNHFLELMTKPLTATIPRLLVNDGRSIRIPPNVWFIGTANQDETTKDFADKTYDRAHVIELPRKRPDFQINEASVAVDPIHIDSLKRAFNEAQRRHIAAAQRSYRFLEEKLGPSLRDKFDVGWGNRLQRQIEAYVPVVIAAGGSLGEATDYILALKILRKTRDRFEYTEQDFKDLAEKLNEVWSQLDSKSTPEKSLDVIAQELRRKKMMGAK